MSKNKKTIEERIDELDIDLDFKTEEDAKVFLLYLSQEQMKLAVRQIKQKTFKREQHQVEWDSYRLSTMRWVFKPGEYAHPSMSFDSVCRRLKLIPDDVRKQFLKHMCPYERKLYLMYQPNLFDKED